MEDNDIPIAPQNFDHFTGNVCNLPIERVKYLRDKAEFWINFVELKKKNGILEITDGTTLLLAGYILELTN